MSARVILEFDSPEQLKSFFGGLQTGPIAQPVVAPVLAVEPPVVTPEVPVADEVVAEKKKRTRKPKDAPVTEEPPVEAATTVVASTGPAATVESLTSLAISLCDTVGMDAIKAVLAKHNVAKLSSTPPELLDVVYAEVKSLA